jgi:hypothetical protein
VPAAMLGVCHGIVPEQLVWNELKFVTVFSGHVSGEHNPNISIRWERKACISRGDRTRRNPEAMGAEQSVSAADASQCCKMILWDT